MKQTAVEWLESEMLEHYSPFDNKLLYEAIHKAKEIEKERIVESFDLGIKLTKIRVESIIDEADFEDYYNETFKQQEQ
jgi:hypothetical protein